MGDQVKFLLLAGAEVSASTLLRFYVLHVLFFPFVIVIFMAVHFLAGSQRRRHFRTAIGSSNGRDTRESFAQIGRGQSQGPRSAGRAGAGRNEGRGAAGSTRGGDLPTETHAGPPPVADEAPTELPADEQVVTEEPESLGGGPRDRAASG